MQDSIGNWLVFLGVCLLVLGIIVKTGVFGWFGNLPGDFHIKREGFQFYFPLASMIVVSVVLSILISLFRRLL